MGNLLFSPTGRINPNEFMKGALILILASIILSIPTALGMTGAIPAILGFVSVITIYCWIVLWIKRYHDSGKSGWMCLIPIIVYMIIVIIVIIIYAGDELGAIFAAAAESVDSTEVEAALDEKINSPIYLAIISLISLGVAFLFNNMIKQDDHENQFGLPG